MNVKKPPQIIDISKAMQFKAKIVEREQRAATEAEQQELKRAKMRKYIQLSKIPEREGAKIDMTMDEMRAILTARDQWEMITLAYKLGLAKGWRAGKRQRLKEQKQKGV